jgi:2-polyprenyl-6-methoxyphenol hydroxylase-like FAD-dependent oxidoreductase
MAMKTDERHALIIGAGIGGLAAAIALRQIGYTVQVFERVRALHEVGAGLTLWPNGVKALRALGLHAFIAEHSLPAAVGGIYTWQGSVLAQTTTSAVERLGGAPTVALHRAELQAALLDALESLTPRRGEQAVQFGAHLEHFEQDEQGVTVYFATGGQARGSVLIGADGLHSAVRQQLFGAEPPRFAGFTAWRAVVPAPPDVPLPAGEYWGCGQEFGVVPLSHQRIYWFATRTVPEGQDDTPTSATGRKQALLRLFHGWYPPIPALIHATAEDAMLRNDIYDRPPLAAWSHGRVTLLGDAAHPMTPNLGQGASQALEDAIVFAASLQAADAGDSVQHALQAYQAVRLPRANWVVIRSHQVGTLIQRTDRLTCWTRNLLIRLLPASLRLKQLEPFIKDEV